MHTCRAPVKVFLAEDSAPIRQRLVQMLSDQGMSVVGQARSPQAAIDGIQTQSPDVVVLDIQLEGGLGMQVLRAIRLTNPKIAFVVLSNNSGPAYRKRYLNAGAVRFLDKSAEFDQLAEAVQDASQACLH